MLSPDRSGAHKILDLTWEELRARARTPTTVVLPTGSLEQHGPHLPVKTDTFLVTSVAEEAVRRVKERVDVLLAPTLWVGLSTHHQSFFSMTLSVETYVQVITELAESLITAGFSRFLFVNGHGGNSTPLRSAVTKIRHQHKVLVATVDYWALGAEQVNRIRESRVGGMGHACEFETSCVMHLEPGVVRRDRIQAEYPPSIPSYFVIDMTRGTTPVLIGTRFEDLTRRGVVGDPTVATPEKGSQFFEAVASGLERLLLSFATWSIEDGLRHDGSKS